ncbi:Ldh family oxidoreductase [Nordella sp. HKS 07]|uniref:Ldh family oxidoreductase n=1 Tax=Nordella sp. HKS 07 TaxID=2712222 RepID=UPI0013E1D200|nr:Ldh family oxidoreductase [Nordella sp. HKS 07]QIG50800.1 Ldh family oxidoreductase [Nordella sp. HKS 07]
MSTVYEVEALRKFARDVLVKAGLPAEPGEVVAKGLVEADLYGHTTHGLALLPDYVEEIENGAMVKDGRPRIISDFGAVALWDAGRLPGIWTTELAVAEAGKRARSFGIGAVVLRRSHHIACLAAFLEAPARDGLALIILSSDPSDSHVAPFGGVTPVMTPNPIAVGIPADPDPILIDVSTSITTAAMCARMRKAGTPLPGKWLLDGNGQVTDDPNVMKGGGSILPIGGVDHGHKGYGLSLMVEALTQGLGGFGRADAPKEWGASVLVLAFAPEAFGGREAFLRQTDWLVQVCAKSAVPAGKPDVRLPGQAALKRKAEAQAHGLALDSGRREGLMGLAKRFALAPPAPI